MPPKVRKLTIKPPQRRGSERMQTRSTSAASTPTTATSGTSAGDTIEVAQKSSDAVADGDAVGGASVETEGHEVKEEGGAQPMVVSPAEEKVEVEVYHELPESPVQQVAQKLSGAAAESTKSSAEKEDWEMVDPETPVTEYDFVNEHDTPKPGEEDENPRGVFKDETVEVITISSDDETPRENFPMDSRPWLNDRGNDYASHQRRTMRERMYALQRTQPLGGDWETTEIYQEQMDLEMEEYIKDFPLQHWAIGTHEAHQAFERMIYRKRMRSVGVHVFQQQLQQQHMAEMGMHQQQMHAQQMPPPPPTHQRSNGAARGHHQMPMGPPQHPPHHMPPPQMMHHGGQMPYGPPPPQYGPPAQHQPPMRQVGVDANGQPLYQPVHQMHHHPPPNQPPSRAPSHSHVPEKRKSPKGNESSMKPYLPEKGRRKRQRVEVPRPIEVGAAPVDPASIPPYPARDRPADSSLKQGKRKPEPSIFPWNRQMDFEKAKATAKWSRGIYGPSTLPNMEKVRADNAAKVSVLDHEENERLRLSRNAKKHGTTEDENESTDQGKESKEVDTGETSGPSLGSGTTAGTFCYATPFDTIKSKALYKTFPMLSDNPSVEDVIDVASSGQVDISMLDAVDICWNPGKKGHTQDLKQVKFSIRDTIITRQQLARTPILTWEAAENIIDFCPDLLWRDILLRITSETQFRNQAIRNRMCKNGNFIDNSTITKRIGSALGQKQLQYGAGRKKSAEAEAVESMGKTAEEKFYEQNVEDYQNYQAFFGKGPSRSRKLGAQLGRQQPATEEAESRPGSSDSDGSVVEVQKHAVVEPAVMGVVKKRDKGKGKLAELPQMDGADEMDVDEEGGVVVGRQLDEVSEQSDGELDRLLGSDSD